ncbi:hypothetical protein BDZ91DRAFT_804656 [Kalaharituber pfeilii]|nr:hypothetical protein BDZ91DRAFT_804656 [Kalaharituber pfeilii]
MGTKRNKDDVEEDDMTYDEFYYTCYEEILGKPTKVIPAVVLEGTGIPQTQMILMVMKAVRCMSHSRRAQLQCRGRPVFVAVMRRRKDEDEQDEDTKKMRKTRRIMMKSE